MKTPLRHARDLLITVGLLYLAAFVALWCLQERFIYPGAYHSLPSWIHQSPPASLERVTIPVGDRVDLAALYRRPAPGQPTILVFHGNGGFPEDYGFLYKSWANSGYGIVAPVYRGYPRSTGTVSADGILRDALSVYDWVIAREPSSPIIVFGQSLGSASAVKVAAERQDVEALVLVSPFLSMESVISAKFPFMPVHLALRSPLRNDLEMPKVKAPTIVFHGDADTLVPVESGQALAALAPSPPRFIRLKNAGHIEGLFGGVMVRAMNRFILEHARP